LGAYSLNNIKTVANSAKSEQIIIASKDDSQFDIIANMYKILLEKNKKYHVTFSRRKDDRQILKELRNGNIDIYPEETRKVFSLIDNSDKKFANIDEL
ncbi:MAG: ABC transporter permease, partial [Lactobacillus iners]|nr:ABC transporter permease [Lactobacillus iners]